MRILFLSRWFPYPPSNGSKLRIFNLLRGLARLHEVTLLSFADQPEVEAGAAELQAVCRQVQVVPWKVYNPHSRRARLGFLSLTPRFVVDTYSQEMARQIEELLATGSYDLVIASQLDMAVYSRHFGQTPALFEEVEVGVLYENFVRAESLWPRLRHGLTWAKHRRYLTSLLRDFQLATVVSERERDLLVAQIPRGGHRPVAVIPNCVDLASYRAVEGNPEPDTLIFTGSFTYQPNYEAMHWFVGQVYPHIQAEAPAVRLQITGNHANQPLPPARGVSLTGLVADVRPLLRRAWLSVVPLHTGGGTRLKILEAMALGTPVVATSKGAEGLDVQAGQHLLIADTPQAFAAQVIRLLREPDLRRQLAENAQQLVQQRYDWAGVLPRFLDLVDQVSSRKAQVSSRKANELSCN